MSKKKIKNNYEEHPFGDPSNYQWGKNIWGDKFTLFGAGFLVVVFAVVLYANSKGLIDWKQADENPLEIQHPHFEKKDSL